MYRGIYIVTADSLCTYIYIRQTQNVPQVRDGGGAGADPGGGLGSTCPPRPLKKLAYITNTRNRPNITVPPPPYQCVCPPP